MLLWINRTTLESGKALSHVFAAFVFLADAASVKCCTSPSFAVTNLSVFYAFFSVNKLIRRKNENIDFQ